MEEAAFAVSIYWIGSILGRIIITSLAGKIKTNTILITLATLSTLGVIFLAYAPNHLVIFTGIGLSGIGLSGIFPLAFTKGSKALSKGVNFAIGVLSVGGSIGGFINPFLTKYVANISINLSMTFAIIFSFVIILIFIIDSALDKKSQESTKEVSANLIDSALDKKSQEYEGS